MLEAIWQLLANFGLKTEDIAGAMGQLIKANVNTDGVVSYEGPLAALAEVPVVGEILKAFASFAPTVVSSSESLIK